MTWRATLSNGEVIDEMHGDAGSWRRLAERCLREDLKVRSLAMIGEGRIEEPPWPVTKTNFFVFHELMGFWKGGKQVLRKGLACVYQDDHGRQKVKVYWHGGNPMRRMFGEVRQLEDFPVANEVAILAS